MREIFFLHPTKLTNASVCRRKVLGQTASPIMAAEHPQLDNHLVDVVGVAGSDEDWVSLEQ